MLRALLATAAAALAFASPALASGGHYVVDGGTTEEQAQVHQALDASSFNWSVVSQTIQIHIAPGSGQPLTSIPEGAATSLPGAITISADVLDLGMYGWGIVQHEYAHQLDFFVLTDAERAQLTQLLGGSAWAYNGELPHQDYTAERFASMLAYTFWPVFANAEGPSTDLDTASAEGSGATPDKLRALLVSWGLAPPPSVCSTVKVRAGHWVWRRLHGKSVRRWVKPSYKEECPR